MRKIGVISDVHGNLQALQVALEYLKTEGCEEIIHCGDVVDIGGNSPECLQLLLDNNVLCLLGNHDRDFISASTQHKPFSHVSAQHKKAVFDSLSGKEGDVLKFPLFVQRICGGKRIVFEHYCRLQNPKDEYVFHSIENNPSAEIFDRMYSHYNCDVVFFGHKHEPCDIVGKRLYVDVGSVGCHPKPVACGIVITFDENNFSYTRFELPYDQQAAKSAMCLLPDGEYLFDFYYLHKKIEKDWD